MKRKCLIVLCCMFLVLFSSTAYANEPGLYLSVQGGFTFLDDVTFVGPGTDGVAYDASSDTGYGILGAIGYDFGMFRLEGEIGYRKNGFEQLTGGGGTIGFEGDQSVLSFMGNGYFDIETNSAFTPYFLLGLGYANVDVSDVKTTDDTTADNFDDSVFAYQFGVGVGYAVTDSVILDLNYRYFATSDLEYDALHGKIEGDCSTHNILFGIRYAF